MRTFLELLWDALAQTLLAPLLLKALTQFRRPRTAPRAQFKSKVRRVFVDVSVISKHDAGTGIQRVVRSLALGLLARAADLEWDLHFVAAAPGTKYRTIPWPADRKDVACIEMDGGPGDVFIGLDYSLDDVRQNVHQLARFRRQGGKLWFLVHDLLPLQQPQWFSRKTVIRYRAWLRDLASLADGFLCNSRQTDGQLRETMMKRYGLSSGFETRVLPMGYRIIERENASRKAPDELHSLFPTLSENYFLMVGTLEPRKGHTDIIDAFDLLWSDGASDRLVFVGRKGWRVDDLCQRIKSHPMHGHQLFWLDDIDDPDLDEIYRRCKGCIISSYAEGFGLPLIESLGYRKPVIARDLPIFREHESCGVRYFPNTRQPDVLAQAIREWAEDIKNDKVTVIVPDKNWDDSVSELIRAFVG